MVMLHNLRPDLQLAYRNPVGSDRIGFATWFLGQAQDGVPDRVGSDRAGSSVLLQLPQLQVWRPLIRQPAGRITQLTMPGAHGGRTNSFRCADCMQIELVCSEGSLPCAASVIRIGIGHRYLPLS